MLRNQDELNNMKHNHYTVSNTLIAWQTDLFIWNVSD